MAEMRGAREVVVREVENGRGRKGETRKPGEQEGKETEDDEQEHELEEEIEARREKEEQERIRQVQEWEMKWMREQERTRREQEWEKMKGTRERAAGED